MIVLRVIIAATAIIAKAEPMPVTIQEYMTSIVNAKCSSTIHLHIVYISIYSSLLSFFVELFRINLLMPTQLGS